MTLENMKTLAEVIALALGGAWAVFGLIVLKQRQKAVTDLRKTELETQTIQLGLRRIAVVRADITAVSHRRPDGPGYYIVAQVGLTNTGGREARIEWDHAIPAFFVRRASFGKDGAPFFTEPAIEMHPRQARDANRYVVSTIIRPGAGETLAFAAYVQTPGIYLLSFRGPLAPQDHLVSEEAGAAKSNPTPWTAHRYILVGETTNDTTRPTAA